MVVDFKLMKKIRVKNNKQASFSLVNEVLKHSPEWDSMKIVVILGNQKDNTYVSIQ
jgi:hypothetical protein